jgi:hypothetical protein
MNRLPSFQLATRRILVADGLLTKFSAKNSSSNVSRSRGLSLKGVEKSVKDSPLRGLEVKSISEEACAILTLFVYHLVF